MASKKQAKAKEIVVAKGDCKIENLGPLMATGNSADYSKPGIRSQPFDYPWNKTALLRPGSNRSRVQISRTLDEEVPFVGYLNKWLPEEALGDGLTVASQSKNDKFRIEATELFDLWASSKKIDVQGQLNWYESQSVLGFYKERDGEVMAYKVKSNNPDDMKRSLSDKGFRACQLQFVRRDQIGSYGIASTALQTAPLKNGLRWDDGISLNDLDKPVFFRVLRRKDGSLIPNDFIDVPANLMIHIKRGGLEGVHGTPAIFRGQKTALDFLDTRALGKFSDKISASFLGAITTPTGAAPGGMTPNIKKGKSPDPNNPGQTVDNDLRFYHIGEGVHIPILKDGESITFFNKQNTLSFEGQLGLLLREMSLSRGLPLDYILNPEKLGSASVRMILRKVQKVLAEQRRPFRNTYCQETWEFVIGAYINAGLLENVPDWNVIDVRNAPDPSIDAGRDEATERAKLKNFTSTIELYCDGLGQEGRKIRYGRLDEIADNIVYGDKRGLPWWLCVDPDVLTALSGLATALGASFQDLGDEIKKMVSNNLDTGFRSGLSS